jgi:hypothetical protein
MGIYGMKHIEKRQERSKLGQAHIADGMCGAILMHTRAAIRFSE